MRSTILPAQDGGVNALPALAQGGRLRTRLLIVAIVLMVLGLAAQTASIEIYHHKPSKLRDGVTVFVDVSPDARPIRW